ncbi:MAG TPA: C25 family cysteine peptidase, partial [Chloroflexota bacterium]|nr:C25 family cysteine peptidase [Chloroflexota bacterium]
DSVAEVESLVVRTLAYEAGTAVPTAFFATDASEGQFAAMARQLWQKAGIPDTAVTHLNGASADEVTAVWNQGAWLTTYIGHGSLALWGKENLFNLEAVSKLQTDQPAIVVQLTCLTGLFAQPGIESLAEVMLQHKHGPVLTVAATSLTLSNHQEPFAAVLLQNLNDPTIQRMGDAFQQAKLSLDISDNGLREISDTFALFGDPSALIVRPPAADGSE